MESGGRGNAAHGQDRFSCILVGVMVVFWLFGSFRKSFTRFTRISISKQLEQFWSINYYNCYNANLVSFSDIPYG